MSIKGGFNIKKKKEIENYPSGTDFQQSISVFFLVFYKFNNRLFHISSLVISKHLLFQNFITSVFHFQSNSTMKFVIFQTRSYSFSLSFQSNPISKYFFA